MSAPVTADDHLSQLAKLSHALHGLRMRDASGKAAQNAKQMGSERQRRCD